MSAGNMTRNLKIQIAILLASIFAVIPGRSQTPQVSASAQSSNSPATSRGTSEAVSDLANTTSSEGRKTNLRLGTVSVAAGYGRIFPPFFYQYGPYGFNDSFYSDLLWSPVWGPYYGPGYFSYRNDKGEIRLAADPKDAAVYVDGAYAGDANRLKSFWLDPGAYDLMVSAKNHQSFQQRIYVLSGKSLKLSAMLAPESKPWKSFL